MSSNSEDSKNSARTRGERLAQPGREQMLGEDDESNGQKENEGNNKKQKRNKTNKRNKQRQTRNLNENGVNLNQARDDSPPDPVNPVNPVNPINPINPISAVEKKGNAGSTKSDMNEANEKNKDNSIKTNIDNDQEQVKQESINDAGVSNLEREHGLDNIDPLDSSPLELKGHKVENIDNIDNNFDNNENKIEIDTINDAHNGDNGHNGHNSHQNNHRHHNRNRRGGRGGKGVDLRHEHRFDKDVDFELKSHTVSHEHLHLRGGPVLFLFLLVIVAQSGVWFWKRKHFKSFFLFTLFGLWMFPLAMIYNFGFVKFVRLFCIWFLFSIIMAVLFKKSNEKPLGRHTPRMLYSWFYGLYRLTSWFCIIGYFMVLFDVFGATQIIFENITNTPVHLSQIGILLLFYGLYFGVLSRDTAQLCSDKMTQTLGFFNAAGLPMRRVPSNICAVCNERLETGLLHNVLKSNSERELDDRESQGKLTATESRMRHMQRREESRRKQEKLESENANAVRLLSNRNITNSLADSARNRNGGRYMNSSNNINNRNRRGRRGRRGQEEAREIHLECGHCFHSFCIRGWVMIGKRNVCPICQEKVDMTGIFANPWHKQDRMWSQLLDAIRYLLVWNPIICMIASIGFNASGMQMEEHVTHQYTVYEIGTTHPNVVPPNNAIEG